MEVCTVTVYGIEDLPQIVGISMCSFVQEKICSDNNLRHFNGVECPGGLENKRKTCRDHHALLVCQNYLMVPSHDLMFTCVLYQLFEILLWVQDLAKLQNKYTMCNRKNYQNIPTKKFVGRV